MINRLWSLAILIRCLFAGFIITAIVPEKDASAAETPSPEVFTINDGTICWDFEDADWAKDNVGGFEKTRWELSQKHAVSGQHSLRVYGTSLPLHIAFKDFPSIENGDYNTLCFYLFNPNKISFPLTIKISDAGSTHMLERRDLYSSAAPGINKFEILLSDLVTPQNRKLDLKHLVCFELMTYSEGTKEFYIDTFYFTNRDAGSFQKKYGLSASATPADTLAEARYGWQSRFTDAQLTVEELKRRVTGLEIRRVMKAEPLLADLEKIKSNVGNGLFSQNDAKKIEEIRTIVDAGQQIDDYNGTLSETADIASLPIVQGFNWREVKQNAAALKASLAEVSDAGMQGDYTAVCQATGNLKRQADNLVKSQQNLWNNQPAVYQGFRGDFGRFGMDIEWNGLLTDDVYPDYLTRSYYAPYSDMEYRWSFFFTVPGYDYLKSKRSQVTWTSVAWERTYRDPYGKDNKAFQYHSLLVPGIQIECPFEEMDFSYKVHKQHSPGAMILPLAEGIKLVRKNDKIDSFTLAENWILLIQEDGTGEIPVLLVLQHNPKIKWGKTSLRLSRPGGIGSLAIGTPFGTKILTQNISKTWNVPPAEVVERCRRTRDLLVKFPFQTREYYTIPDERTVRIISEMVYRPMQTDWKTEVDDFAVIPPILNFAKDQNYPVKIKGNIKDYDLLTKYGPYRTVAGKYLEYELPIPRAHDYTFLNSDLYPELTQKVQNLNLAMLTGTGTSAELSQALPAWLLLSDAQKNNPHLLDFTRDDFRNHMKMDRNAKYSFNNWHSVWEDRVEPSTGEYYRTRGWEMPGEGGFMTKGDHAGYLGITFSDFYQYAKYLGDWDLVRENWDSIRKAYHLPEVRFDWATFGIDCMEGTILYSVDMIGDAYKGLFAYLRMARVAGNQADYDKARYIYAKTAIPLSMVINENLVDYNRQFNNYYHEPKKGAAPNPFITGWDESMIFPPTEESALWTRNVIAGVGGIDIGVYDILTELAPHSLQRWYDEFDRLAPQWKNPDEPGLEKYPDFGLAGMLSPDMLTDEHFLGKPTRTFLAHLESSRTGDRIYWLNRTGSGPGRFYPRDKALFYAMAVGREAPVSLVAWEPGILKSGFYSFATNTATIRLNSKENVEMWLHSRVAPNSLEVNGKEISPKQWRFQPDISQLNIYLEPGETTLALKYPGWEPSPEVPAGLSRLNPGKSYPTEKVPQSKLFADSELDFSLMKSARAIELNPYFNHPLLKEIAQDLPTGQQIIMRGVPFNIGGDINNSIWLRGKEAGKERTDLPMEIKDIKVDFPYRKIYFAHFAYHNQVDEGLEVMRYVINLEGGRKEVVPVQSKMEIADWWSTPIPNAKVYTWQPSSPVGPAKPGVYVMEWVNNNKAADFGIVEQVGVAKIVSIDIESANRSIPVILAITGEE